MDIKDIRILYLTHDGLTDPLGESQVLSYVLGLEESGVKYDLISFEKSINKNKINRIKQLINKRKINWSYIIYLNKPFIIGTLVNIVQLYFILITRLFTNKPNVIHTRSYLMTFIALSLKRFFKIKLIFDIRGFWIDEKIESGSWSLISKLILEKVLRFLEKWAYKSADHIITLTHASKKEIIHKFLIESENVTVIPTCVNDKLFYFNQDSRTKLRSKFKISNDQIVLIYSGAIGGYYDLDEMINIFIELKKLNDKALFFILTRVNHNYVIDKLKFRGVREDDFIINSCDITEVAKYLSMADIGLILYHNSYSAIARSPTKMGEYINCNLHVLAPSKLGDLDYIFNLNSNIGVQFNDFDSNSYKLALESILKLKKINNVKDFKCFNYFNLHCGTESYLTVYNNLL